MRASAQSARPSASCRAAPPSERPRRASRSSGARPLGFVRGDPFGDDQLPLTEELPLTLCRLDGADHDRWLTAAEALLSPAERERAQAINDAGVRARHAVGRAVMRRIGARVSGRDPAALDIATSSLGKPRLVDVPDLYVSVAHTDRLVVVAACRSHPVGVDAEAPVARISGARRIAERRFSSAEARWLGELPDTEFSTWFSRVWTLKEAVGKAVGAGVVPALSGAVAAPDGPELRLASVWCRPAASEWSIHELAAADGPERITVAVPAADVTITEVCRLTPEQLRARAQLGSGGPQLLSAELRS